MKTTTLLAALVCTFIFGTGCTPVKIYSDPSLTKETGLKYYTLKPFIKVERDQPAGNIVKAEFFYLPDLSNPQFLKVKDGPGSRKIDLKLKDGAIIELGIATDPLVAESMEAIASIIDKSAEAAKDIATLKGMTAATNIIEFYEIIMDTDGTRVRKVDF
jgi:hypothetical protein